MKTDYSTRMDITPAAHFAKKRSALLVHPPPGVSRGLAVKRLVV